MVIRPISPVSYANGYNHVNFEGRKKKENDVGRSYSTSSFMKSIPLAVLVAMSPLNGVQAQTLTNSNEKILQTQTYKDPIKDGCNILFISNDGDDSNIEAIVLQHGKKFTYTRNIRGIDTQLVKRENVKQYLDTLKTVNETIKYEDGSPSRTVKKYIASGAKVYDVYVDNAETGKQLKHANGSSKHGEFEIDKELYDYLLQFMDENSVKTENRTRIVLTPDMIDDMFQGM